MSDVPVTLVLPSGGTRNAEVPDDVPVKELLPELTTSLELPVTGPDGRAMSYRLDSKALGRGFQSAAIPWIAFTCASACVRPWCRRW